MLDGDQQVNNKRYLTLQLSRLILIHGHNSNLQEDKLPMELAVITVNSSNNKCQMFQRNSLTMILMTLLIVFLIPQGEQRFLQANSSDMKFLNLPLQQLNSQFPQIKMQVEDASPLF